MQKNLELNQIKELIKDIKVSDTFPGSKKYLFKKIREYSLDGKIDTNEEKKVRKLLKNYNNLEKKYKNYKDYLNKKYGEKYKQERLNVLNEVKQNLEKKELKLTEVGVNEKINNYINNINSRLLKIITNKKKIEKTKQKTNEIKLGILNKNKGLIKLLKTKGINYYDIKNNLSFKDISGFNKKYTENNLQNGSELILKKKGDNYIIEIKPPLLVNKEKFEKEKIPGTNELVQNIVKKECKKEGIIPELYLSLIGTESAFGTNLRSNTGYIGYSMLRKDTSLQQLINMGEISKEEANKAVKNNGKTKENIIAGIKYLSYLYKQFNGYNDKTKIVLAAYNGGEGKIKRTVRHIGLPKNKITFKHIVNSGKISNETKNYPNKILAIAKNFYNTKIV